MSKQKETRQRSLGFVATAAGTPADLDATFEAARLVSLLEPNEATSAPPRRRQLRRQDSGPDL